MNKELKRLLLTYLIFVLIKTVLAYFVPASRALADDYQYLKMSESFFYHFSLRVHDTFSGQLHPLYPVVISIAHIFKDNNLVYFAIKFINVLLTSAIIFPAYYLSREFLSEKKSLLTSIFIGLLPANFSIVSYIMSENLFYVLFLTSIYFIYMSLKKRGFKYYSFAILFSILALLTKVLGLILIALIIILSFIEIFKKRFRTRHLFLFFIISVFLLLWIYYARNVAFDLYLTEALGLIRSKQILAFFIKYISFFGFLLLAMGFFLMLPFFISFKVKDENLSLFRKISLIAVGISLFVAANHAIWTLRYAYSFNNIVLVSGRIVGRYIDFCLPLIMILGFIGLDYYFTNKNKLNSLMGRFTLMLILIMIITTSIILSPLVPFNNVSLTTFGVLKYLIDLLVYSKTSFGFGTTLASYILLSLAFILFPILNYFVLKKFNYKRFLLVFLIFMIFNSLISFGVVYYASKTSWYFNSEQRQLALYLNDIDKERSVVLIDERDYGDLGGVTYDPKALYSGTNENRYTIIGYWLNDELIISDVNKIKADYIISTHEIDLNKVYSTRNGIYVYVQDNE